MRTFISFILCIALSSIYALGQTPILVEDYIFGEQGSVNDRIYNFNNRLVYTGTSQNDEISILEYDKVSDQISVKLTNEDVEFEINYILSNSEEVVIITSENNVNKNAYLVKESDFSDLQKVYSSDGPNLRFFLYRGDKRIIVEENDDGVNITTNLKVLYPDGSITQLFMDLPGRIFDYQFTIVQDHFLISPEVDPIKGQNIVAFNLTTKAEVPITDILPSYQDCGLLQRMGSRNDNIIYYECNNSTFLYDISRGEYLNTNNLSYSYVFDKSDEIIVIYNSDVYKMDKLTGDLTLMLENMRSLRSNGISFLAMLDNGTSYDLALYNYDKDELYNYPTNFLSESLVRVSGFADVPSGLHFMMYYQDTGDGIIARVNSESYTEIDSVFGLSTISRPVAYDEDVYFTHLDSEVGNELFVLDYEFVSTYDFNQIKTINVFPNPASNYLIIQQQENRSPARSRILNQNGNTVLSNATGTYLDISALSTGVYFLKTTYDNGEFGVAKFVKK